jgi:hypothetical protein
VGPIRRELGQCRGDIRWVAILGSPREVPRGHLQPPRGGSSSLTNHLEVNSTHLPATLEPLHQSQSAFIPCFPSKLLMFVYVRARFLDIYTRRKNHSSFRGIWHFSALPIACRIVARVVSRLYVNFSEIRSDRSMAWRSPKRL